MELSRLAILVPDISDDNRYDDWCDQAGWLDALFDPIPIDYIPWTTDAALSGFGLVMPLMAWGYHRHGSRWLEQVGRWEREDVPFANPLAMLRWNTDKRYLIDFAARGVAIVPTRFSASLDKNDIDTARIAFGCAELVVKPPVSAGSDDTFRVAGDAPPEALGQAMLIQPMMPAIATSGELSLFYAGGQLIHAIVKRAASGEFRIQPQFGGTSHPVDPPHAALALAHSALAASGDDILYARIDMVADSAGGYALMEIELIEPYLYLERAPDGGAAFAEAVRSRLG